MRRRGNKSHKVPNVKLRPAEIQKRSRSAVEVEDERCFAQETQPSSDDLTPLDSCPRPFKGVVICATGIQDKPTLFKQALELGAVSTYAFTDRVTHLVADEHGGKKYSCAVARKIPIMQSSWITENYHVWLKGDDVDFDESLEIHRLPIFSDVIVCPSGISDVTRRTKISQLVVAHQGTYAMKLERPVRVTHLLCASREETEKMQYAKKFNQNREANIHIVWEEWFWDSVNFGGRFDEALYSIELPKPELRTVETSTPPPASSEVSSQHDQAFPSSSAPRPPTKPNATSNTSDDTSPDDEQAYTNVLPNVTLQLWSTLLHRRGYQVADGEVILSPGKENAPGAMNAEFELPLPEGTSVINAFRRANSFAPIASSSASKWKEASGGGGGGLPFRRVASAAAPVLSKRPLMNARAGPSRLSLPSQPAGEDLLPRPASPTSPGAAPEADESKQIFAGCLFRVLGEARTANVRQAIEKLGGRVVSEVEDGVDEGDVSFVVVRLVSGSKLYRQEDDPVIKEKYRTECWLESCMFEERILEPTEQATFIPLDIALPLETPHPLLLSLSGFDQSQTCGLKRLFRALGVQLATTFTRRTTHLVCPSRKGQKYDKAREWGVCVVGMEWVWELRSGRLGRGDVGVGSGGRGGKGGNGNGKEKGKAKEKEREVGKGDAMDVDVEVQPNDPLPAAFQDPPSASPLKKSKSLAGVERQSTMIIDDDDFGARPPERSHSMFGMPNEVFGLGQEPPTRASSSFFEEQRKMTSLPATQTQLALALQEDEHRDVGTVTRQATLLNLDNNDNNDDDDTRMSDRPVYDLGLDEERHVPSSNTPSPMVLKTPSKKLRKSLSNESNASHGSGSGSGSHGSGSHGSGSRDSSRPPSSSALSVSPVKIDIDRRAATRLKESITSLLGKRGRGEEDDELDGGEGEGGVLGGGEVEGVLVRGGSEDELVFGVGAGAEREDVPVAVAMEEDVDTLPEAQPPVEIEVPRVGGGRAGKKLRPQRSSRALIGAAPSTIKGKSGPGVSRTRSRMGLGGMGGSQKRTPVINSAAAAAAAVGSPRHSPNRPRTRAVPARKSVSTGNMGAAQGRGRGGAGHSSSHPNPSGVVESQPESVRVTYEDTSQVDERQRLMGLLRSEVVVRAGGGGVGVGIAAAAAAVGVGVGVGVSVHLSKDPETLTLSGSSTSSRQTRRSLRVAG